MSGTPAAIAARVGIDVIRERTEPRVWTHWWIESAADRGVPELLERLDFIA